MNLPITKAKREKLLDEFANSSMPIDLFCQMHHVKEEVIKKELDKKIASLKKEHSFVNNTPNFNKSDFLEIELEEPEIEKVSLEPETLEKISSSSTIRITIGKSVMEIPLNINQDQLQNILTVVKTL